MCGRAATAATGSRGGGGGGGETDERREMEGLLFERLPRHVHLP